MHTYMILLGKSVQAKVNVRYNTFFVKKYGIPCMKQRSAFFILFPKIQPRVIFDSKNTTHSVGTFFVAWILSLD